MKLILFIIISLSLLLQSTVHAQFFDTPGLVNRLQIKTGGQVFEVKTVSSFDIPDYQFSSEEKRLSLIISSSVSNNLAELEIPKNLLNGDFTFYLNGEEIFPEVLENELISFITIEFPGKGLHKLDIIGTIYLSETNDAKTLGADFGLLILIIGIIIVVGAGGTLFLKKRKNNHSLTKD